MKCYFRIYKLIYQKSALHADKTSWIFIKPKRRLVKRAVVHIRLYVVVNRPRFLSNHNIHTCGASVLELITPVLINIQLAEFAQ